jgi:hypothetical protein
MPAQPAVSPIANFGKVDDTVWRGARPDAGGAAWLVDAGVRSVINLELSDEDRAAFAPSPGIVLCHLPDWEPLVLARVAEDRHIREVLAAIERLPKPVYVHCREGENRTGLAVAAYRLVVRGDPLEDVLSDLRSFHGLWEDPDEAYVRSIAARLEEFIQCQHQPSN